MKEATILANAMDGISKTFYVKTEDEIATVGLNIQVQWSSAIPDSILDLIQDRLESLYADLNEAFQKSSGKEIWNITYEETINSLKSLRTQATGP